MPNQINLREQLRDLELNDADMADFAKNAGIKLPAFRQFLTEGDINSSDFARVSQESANWLETEDDVQLPGAPMPHNEVGHTSNSDPTPGPSLADFLRQRRGGLNWSQTELAKRAGLSISTVGLAESGKHISKTSLQKLAGPLKVSIRELQRLNPSNEPVVGTAGPQSQQPSAVKARTIKIDHPRPTSPPIKVQPPDLLVATLETDSPAPHQVAAATREDSMLSLLDPIALMGFLDNQVERLAGKAIRLQVSSSGLRLVLTIEDAELK